MRESIATSKGIADFHARWVTEPRTGPDPNSTDVIG